MELPKVQKANLSWVDGVPVCARFDDPYFSAHDGLSETQHVFLAGNTLPERFRRGFHIAELGFGTGLNLLAAWKLWDDANIAGPLTFTSFEAFPMDRADMQQALTNWPALAPYATQLLTLWPLTAPVSLPNLNLNVITGDANITLPQWSQKADAWFLDGFSPAKNPEMWGSTLMGQVAQHTSPDGTLATYTAAGHVRRGLEDAGFAVSRIKGHGRKRHMSIGRLARDAK